MGNLGKTFKEMIQGTKALYVASFVFQFLMVLFSVFTQFLSKVLVDALNETLGPGNIVDPLEGFVVQILTLGKGYQYLYDNKWILPTAVAVSGLITAFVSFWRFNLRTKAGARIAKRGRMKLYAHLERLPYREYRTQKSGDLIQTCTRDVDLTRKFMMMDLSQMTYTLFTVILCFSILFSISWKLTLVSLAAFPVMFIYSFFLIKEVRRRFRATDDSEAVMVDKISQNLNGVRVIKAYNGEKKEIAAFEETLKDYGKKFAREKRLSAFFFGSSDIFIFASRTVAIIYAIYLVFAHEITAGTVVISYTFVNMMVWPLRNTATTLSNLGQTLAATDRIQKLLSIELEDTETGSRPVISGNMEFDHVSFAFPDDPNTPILDDVSFSVKKGQTVAIMGKTGSGKSTLIQVLTRLYPLTGGKIVLDDVDVKDIALSHLRRNIVPVLQDPFLFSKTISQNIKIAKPEATEEDIRRAARIAAVDGAIEGFKEGYDTAVGEKGVTLSGGQKQRVAIARTVISGAPILVFDDSLSAVDTATDLAIRSELKELQGSSTVLLITHRVMSAKDADLIIVLDHGKIAEMGTNDELIHNNGLYKRIADIQSSLG